MRTRLMKRLLFSLLVLLTGLLLLACGGGGGNDAAPPGEGPGGMADPGFGGSGQEKSAASRSEQSSLTGTAAYAQGASERKIIYRADYELQVDRPDQTKTEIQNRVGTLGGWLQSLEKGRETEQGSSWLSMEVRVPSGEFQSFTSWLEGKGKVVSAEVNSDDVTEEYVDVQSRLKSLETSEERLLEMMETSSNLENLIKAEERLTEVQQDIERLKGRLRYLDNRVDYSRVSITLNQKPKVPEETFAWNLEEAVGNSTNQSLRQLREFARGTIAFFLGNLPLWGLLLIIGVPGYLFVRKRWTDWLEARQGESE